MQFPYGISDFHKLITEGYFYADRTHYIPLIERAGPQILFLRPRRFGKSLLLSMLENYYDLARADQFAALFGHLAIGRQPTPLHNRFFVLKWDFSAVEAHGPVEQIRRSLHNHLNAAIEGLAARYRGWLPDRIQIDSADALYSFQSALTAIRSTPYRLYLLIDEYDNFANEVVMGGRLAGRAQYADLVRGEGVIRSVFKAVKAASAGLGLDRVFITGVSPVVLSDVTSGYNVAKSLSLDERFADLCGFRETEIAQVLRDVAQGCELPAARADEALTVMRTFYNGYSFSEAPGEPLYNPTLALYFLDYFQTHCRFPPQLLDSNLALDRNKLAYIAQLPEGAQFIFDALSGEPPIGVQQLADRFGVEEMLSVPQDATFMASLLYFFGILTLRGRTATGHLHLAIPNLVVRRLYVERLAQLVLPEVEAQNRARRLAEAFYSSGDLQPLCAFIEDRYFRVFDNRDYRWLNELTLKTAFVTLLFDDAFYMMTSEAALEHSYADLVMLIRPEMRQYQLLDFLFEFKVVSPAQAGLRREQIKQASRDDLLALKPVQQRLSEARASVQAYRARLQTQVGPGLRLRAFVVVSLGFDRIVWEEDRT